MRLQKRPVRIKKLLRKRGRSAAAFPARKEIKPPFLAVQHPVTVSIGTYRVRSVERFLPILDSIRVAIFLIRRILREGGCSYAVTLRVFGLAGGENNEHPGDQEASEHESKFFRGEISQNRSGA